MSYIIEQRIKDKNYNNIIKYKDYDLRVLYDYTTDKYFVDIDEMTLYYKEHNLYMPRYVYGCYFESVELDLEWILEYVCDEHAEGVYDSLCGVEELQKVIDKFNKINRDNEIGSFYEDYRTIIDLEG